jgi:hypothetical protein
MGLQIMITGIIFVVVMVSAVNLDGRPDHQIPLWWKFVVIVPGLIGGVAAIVGALMAVWGINP